MEKPFFEVFPALKIENPLHDRLAVAKVERVASTKKRDTLRIYLFSQRLILKEDIWAAEKEIKRQLFPDVDLTVRIQERFELSSLYTPENLMEVYRESLLAELREYSYVEYNAFRTADLTYPAPGTVLVTIDDTVPNRSKASELSRVLEKVVVERCGLEAGVEIAYREARTGKYAEDEERKIQMRVDEICRRMKRRGVYPADAEADKTESTPAADGFVRASAASVKTSKGGAEDAAEMGQDQSAKASGSTGDFRGGGARRGDLRRGKGRKAGGDRSRPVKQSDKEDVIYGREFEDEAIPIEDIIGEMGDVTIRGKLTKLDTRESKSGWVIVIFDITDFTDTIAVKLFLRGDQAKEVSNALKVGSFVKLKGTVTTDRYDHELTVSSLYGIRKINDFTATRMDTAARKRVELHCHTKMSEMDGVSETSDIVRRACAWGHKAIAITDHGVVQGFTDANHTWEDLWGKEKAKRLKDGQEHPDKQDFFKVIYGVEAYLVDDLKEIVTGDTTKRLQEDFVVFDIETTGFSPVNSRIIEIGAVKIKDGGVVDRFSAFVNPKAPIPLDIENLTGINDQMVAGAPAIEEVLPEFLRFCEGCALVAHNASFDMSFIQENARRQGLPSEFTYVDTVGVARVLLPELKKHTLDAVAKALRISLENHHRAVDDAECTALIFVRFIQMLAAREIGTLSQLNELGRASVDLIRKMPTHHAIILAKNDLGRIHLYKLVSESHLTYYAGRHPRIPKSLLMKYREGLIVGSACEAGELYRALLDGQSDTQVARLVDFYDYLEIQPCDNNRFMIESEKMPGINSREDIREINRRIVKLGGQFRKPVVATCDVHFLDPEDEIYRRIIMAGYGYNDSDAQAPLYLHTTEEMLEEFSYLGSDKAYEVVVRNTNMIADMIETISPVRPDKCAPVIPDSDRILTEICYSKAHEIYGPELPGVVEERLERELNSIISNGFAVMYIIAQKLVWKSVEDGYLVGSRGSVGSSFVATMSGITEVNPLSPHYYCSECHYADFDSDEVKAYAGKAGVDMPDKACPVCGSPLHKEGFDIPFETFLGFKGDKEPDIDLNFSGEYQSKAHKYTEVIFGAGQTYRAGTIATLADKTAYGYVRGYFEERGKAKRASEIERIALGCTGVRRSTGQHPGGIVVLPLGQDINSFTPVQHPANDMETDIVTTHFDYHSIDHNLLKLDILGHDDPTMIRMLQDMTGVDPQSIPLDGEDVMSLFQNTDALGITPDQIGGTKLGILGIPEFGTDFAMQMVIEAQPKAFSDLVRISGLAHGTDVWLGNTQKLIQEGTATISTAICTRDDIMTYLIQMGVESEKAFKIMEAVRKGNVAKGKCDTWEEWKADMEEHHVPSWYIWSCEKIKYMFPKAHAAAYVMMAWRIAYCKIHYPLAYYGAFFAIRAKAFSYEMMCQGKAHLETVMASYKRRMEAAANKESGAEPLSNREEAAYSDMRVVQEMYARGYEFMPIDIFRAHSRNFLIIDGKLMPSLNSIEGLGEKAADAIVEAARQGPFLSKDDFRARTKVSKTMVDMLGSLKLLGDIPESDQLSLFDFF